MGVAKESCCFVYVLYPVVSLKTSLKEFRHRMRSAHFLSNGIMNVSDAILFKFGFFSEIQLRDRPTDGRTDGHDLLQRC